jgi:hypothetical protein
MPDALGSIHNHTSALPRRLCHPHNAVKHMKEVTFALKRVSIEVIGKMPIQYAIEYDESTQKGEDCIPGHEK